MTPSSPFNSSPPPLRHRPKPTAQGFTLLEVLFATILISLILMGVVDLFISASKLTVRANAIAATGLSSANAVQQIVQDTREAQALSMPDDGAAFTPLANYTSIASYYKTTYNGQPIVTALELSIPAQQGTSVTVLDSSGASKTPAVYDRLKASGDYILFYRGNADQSPNPSSGNYLWRYQHSTNTALPVSRNIASAGDAVQFIQPTNEFTQVAVKIVSSEYSLIHGQQTNEESDGTTTSSLTGKCVLMRDYDNTRNGGGSIDSNTCNHAFQHG